MTQIVSSMCSTWPNLLHKHCGIGYDASYNHTNLTERTCMWVRQMFSTSGGDSQTATTCVDFRGHAWYLLSVFLKTLERGPSESCAISADHHLTSLR